LKLKRIFIAFWIPPQIQSILYSNYSKKIDTKLYKVVKEENLHITLSYLGYLGEQKISEIIENLNSLPEYKKFQASIGKPGMFHKRVHWIGIENGTKEMIKIAYDINETIGIDDNKFHPHITIARARKTTPDNEIKEIKKSIDISDSLSWEVDGIALMESQLKSTGPVYSMLKKFPFK